jgi:hypothetical protein
MPNGLINAVETPIFSKAYHYWRRSRIYNEWTSQLSQCARVCTEGTSTGRSPVHHGTSVLRQRIIDEFNVLRQHPEMIYNAVRHMHNQTILCVERNGGHVEGHNLTLFFLRP